MASDIVKEDFSLPKVPQLLGEENLKAWKDAINQHFMWYDIEEYLTTDVQEPQNQNERRQWIRNRLKGTIIINGSLYNKAIADKLNISGFKTDEMNPKVLYNHILRVIPTTSETSARDLFMELVTMNRNKYDSLIVYQSRYVYLRDKLNNIGLHLEDRGYIILTIEGLRQSNPSWYTFWIYELEKGTLT
jgi:hypothetical protein